jgi:hypothetical protein
MKNNKTFKKPSKYITFGNGWNKYDDDGVYKQTSVAIDPARNAKANGTKDGPGQGYKLFLMPVTSEGDFAGDPIEVKEFVLSNSGADKSQYPNAPDLRVWAGIVE